MGLYLDYLGNDKFRVDNSITQGSTHLEDLRLPEGDHGVPGRRLEGGHLAAVVEEGLHEAGARQDDGAVQGRVELAAMWAQCHDSYNLLSHGVQHTVHHIVSVVAVPTECEEECGDTVIGDI